MRDDENANRAKTLVEALVTAQARAKAGGKVFSVYYIEDGRAGERRYAVAPSGLIVPSAWNLINYVGADGEILRKEEESGSEIYGRLHDTAGAAAVSPEATPSVLCEDCLRGLTLSADGSNHIFGEKVGAVRPCGVALNVEDDFRAAVAFAQEAARAEKAPFVIYRVTDAGGVQYKVRKESLKLRVELLRGTWTRRGIIPPLDNFDATRLHVASVDNAPPAATDGAAVTLCHRTLATARAYAKAESDAVVCGVCDCLRAAIQREQGAGAPAFLFVGEVSSEAAGLPRRLEIVDGAFEAVDPLRDPAPPNPLDAPSKKEDILRLYDEGVTDIADIVRRVSARPSYVAQVLEKAGHLQNYFDLYQTTSRESNVYTRYFRNVLAFRNVEAARESVQKIDRLFNYFERLGDRAGQHQATVLALTGKNRARWSGKLEEAEIFGEWLNSH